MYTLVYKTHGTKDYDPPRHHPIFRSSSNRRVNLCSSWTHAWTLNSCTIVSPRYEEGEAGEGRGERRVSSHCSSGPGHGEPRSVINDTRNGRVLPSLSLPSLDSRTIRRGGGRPIYRFDLPDTYTRGLLQPVDGGPPLLITNGCNESFVPPPMGLFILGREVILDVYAITFR